MRTTDRIWHHLSASDVVGILGVGLTTGLSSEEAHRRQRVYGPNRVTSRRGTPALLKFLRQFNAPLVYILLLASGITAALGEWLDSSAIFGVVIINAFVGFLQESRAEEAIDALSNLVTTEATVRRDGCKKHVRSEQLVPGDIVLLQAGDCVPADLRLFQVRNLRVDESALTGESLPVAKNSDPLAPDTILAERKNLAYAGTLVTSGHAEGVVWAIGDLTETGRIARLISEALELSTPLTRKIAQFSRILLWLIMALALTAFAIGVTRGEKPVEMFMAAVAIAVGAIPEGLPAAVTIVLAIGVSRMAGRRAIIRKLPAVETLGSTTVICSDKTGTLTENQMTVQEIYAGGILYEVTGVGYKCRGDIRVAGQVVKLLEHPALAECLRAGALCNEAQLVSESGRSMIHGDPTEAAMLVAAAKGGLDQAAACGVAPRVDMIPFDSGHMFRATLHEAHEGRLIYQVGALERLLERCAEMLGQGDSTVPLEQDNIRQVAEAMAARGLRILALARRRMPAHHGGLHHGNVANGLTFLGLQAMRDPPRPEAITAVNKCQLAGISVKMITGDHLGTARAIAEQIGLRGRDQHGRPLAVSGRELEKMEDAELPDVAERTTVFARVAPEQKLRLVKALQLRGHVVAVTGDGVNDAPALRQADIGVAMGISGTDVAKAAADMILTDDNFASLEAAVEEGRGVFANLTKFIVWTLPTNTGEALVLLLAILLGTDLPAMPVQLLWVNMTTGIFLGLMLVFEPKEAGLMTRPPRDPKRPLITVSLLMRTGFVSLIILVGASWLFFWEINVEGKSLAAARTAVVNVIVLVETSYLFSCRSLMRSVFAIGWFSNKFALAGALAMLVSQLLFTYNPVMNRLFHSAPINGESWLRVICVAVIALAAVELEKWIRVVCSRDKPVTPD